MPIYQSSKGAIDTSTMAQPHLERALAKAQREGNQENTKSLEEELSIRSASEK